MNDLAALADVPIGDGGGEDMRADFAAPPTVPSNQKPEHVEKLLRWSNPLQTINLVDELQETAPEKIAGLGVKVVEQFQIDEDSRADWLTRMQSAMDLAMQVPDSKKKEYPWPDAANVIYPLISTAAIQFQARAYPAIVPGPKIVKGFIVGKDDGEPLRDPHTGEPLPDPKTGDGIAWAVKPGAKQARSDRISEHMSWQLLEEQEEWEPETDLLTLLLPIVGCAFRKTFFSRELNRNVGALIKAKDLTINYRARSMETAPRLTEHVHLYPVEIEEAIRSEAFVKHEFGAYSRDEDELRPYLEQHRWVDLDGDGYPEPYIVTVHKQTTKVVQIVPRYEPEGIICAGVEKKVRKIHPIHYYTKYDFLPNPDGGIYGVGFGLLLGPINESVDTTLNQIFDAGHLQTTGGGFIGKGPSLKSGSLRFRPGEYKVLNVLGSSLRDAIVPLQFPGPSPVLFQLLGLLIEAAKEMSSNTELLAGRQQNANVPATTTMALIEQGLKVFTGIYKRIYRSLKSELAKQYRLNRIYLDKTSQYRFRDEWKVIEQKDYREGGGIEPISDPSMVSDMQELARAEGLVPFKDDPLVDRIEVRRRYFTAMKQRDVEKLLVQKAPPDPAVQIKSLELALKQVEVKARAITNLATAVKNLAEADVAVDENFRGWLGLHLESMRGQMEALAGDGGEDATDGERPDQGGLPVVAAPSGDQSVPAVSR